jgi:CMP-N-acetylneuraminic acid synthetase
MPLIEWSIRFALKTPQFDKVVVSTDCEEIAAISRAAGIDVPYLRSAELASDTATSADVALDVLEREGDYDLIALLQPTSPVREPSHWDLAFRLIRDRDAVVGVLPRNHIENDSRIAGSLYLIRADALRREKTFCPFDTALIVCSHPIDIDTEDDFIAAEAMVRQKAYVSVFGIGTP